MFARNCPQDLINQFWGEILRLFYFFGHGVHTVKICVFVMVMVYVFVKL